MRLRLAGAGVVLAMLLCLPAAASATRLYITNQNTSLITAYDIAADGSLSQISCPTSNCSTGQNPEQLVITPDNRFLYAANAQDNTLSEFSVASDGSLNPLCGASCPATGTAPIGAATSPNGKFVFAANQNANTISPFGVGSDGSLTPISCGAGCATQSVPDGTAVTPNGNFLYTADQGSGYSGGGEGPTVSEFSIGPDGTLTPLCNGSTCPVTPNGTDLIPVSVTPDGKFLYTGDRNAGGIYAYAINSNGTLSAITCASCTAGTGLSDIAIAPNGKYLYAANQNADSISAFSINSDGALSPIACSACSAGSPTYTSLSVEPGSRYLYAMSQDGTLYPFSINSDGSLTQLSCSPSVCSVNGGQSVDVFDLVISPDQAPVAAFTDSTGRPGKPTSFNASGSTAYVGASVAQYAWNFGDGTTTAAGGPTAKHTYKKPGKYRVTLTVTDSLGCSTQQVFTGQTMSCNGSAAATITHTVHVAAVAKAKKARLTLSGVPRVCVRSSRRIGVHVHTASGSAPHKTSVSVDGHRVARSRKLSFSLTLSLRALKVGRNTVKAVSVDRFGRRSTVSAHVARCSTSAAFTG